MPRTAFSDPSSTPPPAASTRARSGRDAIRARVLLGTLVELRIIGCDDPIVRSRAFAAAFAAVERVHARMSFHDPDSDLSRLNRAAANAPQRVDAWTLRVLRVALALHEASGGLFDPSIAPRRVARGFLPRPPGAPDPDPSARLADVVIDADGRVRYGKPLWLDLGGIAKGFAVDAAVAALRASGIRTGLVNAGGDLRAFGATPLPVEIRSAADPRRLDAPFVLARRALATSAGTFERGDFAIERPAGGEVVARRISVVAPRCVLADALTKVVALAGDAARPLLDRCRASAIVR